MQQTKRLVRAVKRRNAVEHIVDKIREQYPVVHKCTVLNRQNDSKRCVLGAVHAYFTKHGQESNNNFPADTWMLGKLNPQLSQYMQHDLGTRIVVANEEGNFELAWSLVREAADYVPT